MIGSVIMEKRMLSEINLDDLNIHDLIIVETNTGLFFNEAILVKKTAEKITFFSVREDYIIENHKLYGIHFTIPISDIKNIIQKGNKNLLYMVHINSRPIQEAIDYYLSRKQKDEKQKSRKNKKSNL